MIDLLSLLPGLTLSDHTCIQFTYTCYTQESNNYVPTYNIHQANYKKLWNLLSNVNWNDVIGIHSVLDAWGCFSDTLTGSCNKLFL